jgi:general secretion pathway protein G
MKINKSGFTLIELLVVSTILAVLMTVGVVSYRSTTLKSRDTKRTSDLEQIRTALEMYRADKGSYPVSASAENPTDLSNPLTTDGYMQNIPEDPVSTYSYRYTCPDSGDSYCYSYTLSAYLEGGSTGSTACTDGANNFCVKNP